MGHVLDKEAVLDRLCVLVSHVGAEVYQHVYCHDCFCGLDKNMDDEQVKVDEPVIRFIEIAVMTAVQREQEQRVV